MSTKKTTAEWVMNNPAEIGRLVGFGDLSELHNSWIKDMVLSTTDKTLQAHRGSYKTTCVSVALSLLMILKPHDKLAFFRKTDSDVKEVIKQTRNILLNPHVQYIVQILYGKDLILVEESQTAISTNLSISIKGTQQLTGIGTQSSLTGRHYDIIFTDDIVNLKDRQSRAERERVKYIYQELQNLKNRGGRIYNTGTPWHKDDCFSIMPAPKIYDCYSTGLINDEELADIKSKMTRSLFAANYELRHIAEEDVLFDEPKTGYDADMAEQGICHIDAAYYGEDYTAFTICNKHEGNYYVMGKVWRKHVDDVEDEILALRQMFNAGKIYCEDNGDKGYLKKHLKSKGERAAGYHESMNKHVKITTYLKEAWNNVYFVKGTDEEYISMICDYNEDAEHDDAPDSLASVVRILRRKNTADNNYNSLWN